MAEEDYLGQPYPHPYVDIWLECKRHANQYGVPLLPEPEKGVLDQDADLMLAFEVLDAFQEQQADEETRRQKLKEELRQRSFGLPDASSPFD